MKFDPQKAFPYPVLRPHNDDYLDSDIQTTAEFLIDHDNKKVKFNASLAISSEAIQELIESNKANYSIIISCRSTFFRKSLRTNSDEIEYEFNYGDFRDEVEVTCFVTASEDIDNFLPEDLNPEFGDLAFNIEKGDVLALDEPQISFFDRDSFKPLASIFSLIQSNNRSDNEFRVELDHDDITIAVSPTTKQMIDIARNNPSHLAVLMNSLYFSALVEAINQIQQAVDEYENNKWASVLSRKIHNTENIDIDTDPAYVIAQELFKMPMLQLKNYVFKEKD
ncbi:hypothetical protein BCU94_18485 [Shewanella sp. 10N.286.52.C2]|uniref:hypothetical protein n=1 Tax=Shewanella sp. 10N.286.52.C2 TaxID=1880838 RepID=UPI000C85758F|nr:hypothetical protein [Shewanella sp. 10N.286.52.C2]PMG28018.1 hypothetical protein BCU94_18485 [Shewanella sp. 10N.286.52.C2]